MMQSVDDLVAQLRPITGPEAAPPAENTPMVWLWIAVAVALVALVAFLAAILLRRRRRAEIPPDREALMSLNRLPETPSPKSLAELDYISRRYLGRAHFIASEHMTSAELLIVLPDEVSSEWSAIFAQLQPGRFSRRSITTEEWGSLIQQVRPLIRVVHGDIADSVVQRS